MDLIEKIGSGPVALDTCIFIYFMEADPAYLPVVASLFESIDAGSLQGVTSDVTLLETLVIPYRTGDDDLADRYQRLLTKSRNLECVPLGRTVLKSAAMLRAHGAIRTPDALQLATALSRGCSAFVTNDRDLLSLGRLKVLQLRNFV